MFYLVTTNCGDCVNIDFLFYLKCVTLTFAFKGITGVRMLNLTLLLQTNQAIEHVFTINKQTHVVRQIRRSTYKACICRSFMSRVLDN